MEEQTHTDEEEETAAEEAEQGPPAEDREGEGGAKEGESKSEAWVRLTEARVKPLLKRFDILDHLANTSTYAYTDEQVDIMFMVIERRLNESRKVFKKVKEVKKDFSFADYLGEDGKTKVIQEEADGGPEHS